MKKIYRNHLKEFNLKTIIELVIVIKDQVEVIFNLVFYDNNREILYRKLGFIQEKSICYKYIITIFITLFCSNFLSYKKVNRKYIMSNSAVILGFKAIFSITLIRH